MSQRTQRVCLGRRVRGVPSSVIVPEDCAEAADALREAVNGFLVYVHDHETNEAYERLGRDVARVFREYGFLDDLANGVTAEYARQRAGGGD